MPIRDTGTEELIKNTAKKIFLVEGRLKATTEDIGKEAGIPRTSVHYYFRSRDILFREVFNEARRDFTTRLNNVITSQQPFREKLETYIDVCLCELLKYPYLENFVVNEMISQEYTLIDKDSPVKMKGFLKEIKSEMDNGTIPEMNPVHFVLNLFSLLVYPSIASPLIRELFKFDQAQYDKLLKERKKIILKLLLK